MPDHRELEDCCEGDVEADLDADLPRAFFPGVADRVRATYSRLAAARPLPGFSSEPREEGLGGYGLERSSRRAASAGARGADGTPVSVRARSLVSSSVVGLGAEDLPGEGPPLGSEERVQDERISKVAKAAAGRTSSGVFAREAQSGGAAPPGSGTFASGGGACGADAVHGTAAAWAQGARVHPADPIPKVVLTFGLSGEQRDELLAFFPDLPWRHLALGAPAPRDLRGAIVCCVVAPGEWTDTVHAVRGMRRRWPANPVVLMRPDTAREYGCLLEEDASTFGVQDASAAATLVSSVLRHARDAERAVIRRASQYRLTQRETQIVALYMLGVRRSDIPHRLGIAKQTAANTINLMLGKIEGPTLAEAVQRHFR